MRPTPCGRSRRNGADWLCARPWKTVTMARGQSSRSRMPASASGRTGQPACSTRSTRRSRADWAWGCPSAARSLTITGDVSGRRRTRVTAPPFTSLCRGYDDDHRDAEERNRRRRRHALGHARVPLLRDERGSPRHVGLLLMSSEDPVVFVVDDDKAFRDALRRLLTSVGLSVEVFPSAQAFLGSPRRHAPGCLVLDVRLPGLSGLDLQQELVNTDTTLPIIFLTGHGDIPMSVRAMKAGAVEFLTKPFREQDLLDAVRIALEKDSERREREKEVSDLKELFKSLTPREQEVISMVVSGMLNKQIADQLGTAANN